MPEVITVKETTTIPDGPTIDIPQDMLHTCAFCAKRPASPKEEARVRLHRLDHKGRVASIREGDIGFNHFDLALPRCGVCHAHHKLAGRIGMISMILGLTLGGLAAYFLAFTDLVVTGRSHWWRVAAGLGGFLGALALVAAVDLFWRKRLLKNQVKPAAGTDLAKHVVGQMGDDWVVGTVNLV